MFIFLNEFRYSFLYLSSCIFSKKLSLALKVFAVIDAAGALVVLYDRAVLLLDACETLSLYFGEKLHFKLLLRQNDWLLVANLHQPFLLAFISIAGYFHHIGHNVRYIWIVVLYIFFVFAYRCSCWWPCLFLCFDLINRWQVSNIFFLLRACSVTIFYQHLRSAQIFNSFGLHCNSPCLLRKVRGDRESKINYDFFEKNSKEDSEWLNVWGLL